MSSGSGPATSGSCQPSGPGTRSTRLPSGWGSRAKERMVWPSLPIPPRAGLADEPIEEGLEEGVARGALLGVELDAEDRSIVIGLDPLDHAVRRAAVHAQAPAE